MIHEIAVPTHTSKSRNARASIWHILTFPISLSLPLVPKVDCRWTWSPAGVCTVCTMCIVYSVHTAAFARPRAAHARGVYGSIAWIHRAGYPCAVRVVPVQIYQNFVIFHCRARANEIDYMNFSYAFHG
jgi:hypothetical protein